MSEQLVTPENVTTKDGKINLLDLNRQQMREFFKDLGEKPFRADQVMKWMYHYCCDNFDEMTDINKVLRAAAQPHRFVGINQAGQVALLQTQGNPDGHVILRGGKAPNYSPADVAQCEKEMEQAGLRPSLMVDCSHGNSNKDYRRQPAVAESVVAQIKDGNRSIIGLMIESNIHEGNQSSEQPRSEMKYGVSVTDACISWEMTDALLREIHQDLNGQLTARVA